MTHACLNRALLERSGPSGSGHDDGGAASADAERTDAFARRRRLDVEGKTIDEVSRLLSSALRNTELDPEWISPANTLNDADEVTNGARFGRIWPADSAWDRVAVSVDIGRSEGWIVHVDWITRTELPGIVGRGYAVMPLLRAKTLVCDRAWELARFISYAIDVA